MSFNQYPEEPLAANPNETHPLLGVAPEMYTVHDDSILMANDFLQKLGDLKTAVPDKAEQYDSATTSIMHDFVACAAKRRIKAYRHERQLKESDAVPVAIAAHSRVERSLKEYYAKYDAASLRDSVHRHSQQEYLTTTIKRAWQFKTIYPEVILAAKLEQGLRQKNTELADESLVLLSAYGKSLEHLVPPNRYEAYRKVGSTGIHHFEPDEYEDY